VGNTSLAGRTGGNYIQARQKLLELLEKGEKSG
jgi:hypothetical protein